MDGAGFLGYWWGDGVSPAGVEVGCDDVGEVFVSCGVEWFAGAVEEGGFTGRRYAHYGGKEVEGEGGDSYSLCGGC